MTEDRMEGLVESLAFGGQGILRKEGCVYFVPFTAPEDLIEFEIVDKKKNYGIGRLLQIKEASPTRVEPLCPYFGKCGGCQLQHIKYEVQCQFKKKMVQDALERLGKLSFPPIDFVPATQPWFYRQHITLTIHSPEEIGYISIDHHTLEVVDFCPIFAPQEDNLIRQVKEITKALKIDPEGGRVIVLKSGSSAILYYQFSKMPINAQEVFEKNKFEGILVRAGTRSLTFGKISTQIEVEGLKFIISPLAFLQNNREISLKINQKILQIAQDKKNILDLYCGLGITSLLLAKQGKNVCGVEGNKEAVKLAKENAHINGLKANFLVGDVKKILPKISSSQNLTIINPPRTGLEREVVEFLTRKGSEELIYISCMPSTLARDLKILCEKKYAIKECIAFDMFPETSHVETLVHLIKQYT